MIWTRSHWTGFLNYLNGRRKYVSIKSKPSITYRRAPQSLTLVPCIYIIHQGCMLSQWSFLRNSICWRQNTVLTLVFLMMGILSIQQISTSSSHQQISTPESCKKISTYMNVICQVSSAFIIPKYAKRHRHRHWSKMKSLGLGICSCRFWGMISNHISIQLNAWGPCWL